VTEGERDLGRNDLRPKISPKKMVKLYKSLVVPHLEYAAPVWQCSPHVQLLEKVQRKGLSVCLGGIGSDSCMALEIQSCVLPLDLRREEISVRECCKIMAKDDTSLLKQTLNEYRNEITDDKVTLITKMIRQVC
jgi:hypothetical protein